MLRGGMGGRKGEKYHSWGMSGEQNPPISGGWINY